MSGNDSGVGGTGSSAVSVKATPKSARSESTAGVPVFTSPRTGTGGARATSDEQPSLTFRTITGFFSSLRGGEEDEVDKAQEPRQRGSIAEGNEDDEESPPSPSSSGRSRGGSATGDHRQQTRFFDRDIVAAAATRGPQDISLDELSRRAEAIAAAQAQGTDGGDKKIRRSSSTGVESALPPLAATSGNFSQDNNLSIGRQTSVGANNGTNVFRQLSSLGRASTSGGNGSNKRPAVPSFVQSSPRLAPSSSVQQPPPLSVELSATTPGRTAQHQQPQPQPLVVEPDNSDPGFPRPRPPTISAASAAEGGSGEDRGELSAATTSSSGIPSGTGGLLSSSNSLTAGSTAPLLVRPPLVEAAPAAAVVATDGAIVTTDAQLPVEPSSAITMPQEPQQQLEGGLVGAGGTGLFGAGGPKPTGASAHTLFVIEFRKGSTSARYSFMRKADILSDARSYAAAAKEAGIAAARATRQALEQSTMVQQQQQSSSSPAGVVSGTVSSAWNEAGF
jgi:hypothetical protein